MMNCSCKETQVKLRNPELKEVQQRRGEEREREREQVISAEKMTPARAVNPPPAEVVIYTERL